MKVENIREELFQLQLKGTESVVFNGIVEPINYVIGKSNLKRHSLGNYYTKK